MKTKRLLVFWTGPDPRRDPGAPLTPIADSSDDANKEFENDHSEPVADESKVWSVESTSFDKASVYGLIDGSSGAISAQLARDGLID